jgi:hypothetical protein
MTTVSHSSCLVLNVIPARVVVEERLDETVACRNDDTIVSASPLPQIVERGKLADGLIVEAVCDKYLEHLPVERQCARFARDGVDVAPAESAAGLGTARNELQRAFRSSRPLRPSSRGYDIPTRAVLLGRLAPRNPPLKPEHVGPRVQAVAVHRMPPGLELPGLVPAAKRWHAHAEKVRGLGDRQQPGDRALTRNSHADNLTNVDHEDNDL